MYIHTTFFLIFQLTIISNIQSQPITYVNISDAIISIRSINSTDCVGFNEVVGIIKNISDTFNNKYTNVSFPTFPNKNISLLNDDFWYFIDKITGEKKYNFDKNIYNNTAVIKKEVFDIISTINEYSKHITDIIYILLHKEIDTKQNTEKISSFDKLQKCICFSFETFIKERNFNAAKFMYSILIELYSITTGIMKIIYF